ncbi:ABC transporter permease [Terriglobus aquaticus]|uniref:ABC transporter permease n=1 Tax=Terriglobus aquaticus TaxID=940139 RepID=A0ABW9KLL2_9BACT|nr:ABC transporter permease [Terriglobus aquaticus]
MNKLVVGNLTHRPLRSVISILAVAVEVIMILSIAAILIGKVNGYHQHTSGIGMDMVVRPNSVNSMVALSSAGADLRVAPILDSIPNVDVVAPVNIQLTSSLDSIYGIDFPSFNALTPFKFLEGGPFTQPTSIILDDYVGKGKHPGDPYQVFGHTFIISGIVEHGRGGRKYVPLTTMGQYTGTEGKCTVFYLKTTDAPKHQNQVRDAIHATEGMQSYNVQTLDEYLSQITPDKLPALKPSMYTVTGIAVVVGFLVIFQSMYTAIMERTREIGILKSLGASRGYIVQAVLAETLLLSALGIVVGVAFSVVLNLILNKTMPTLDYQLSWPWVIRGILLAFAGALLGALYPAFKAASKDPIDALAYE